MISVFVRSYPGDFAWLEYSVQSMKKNLTGFNESVLVLPEDCIAPQCAREFFTKVIHLPETYEGYIQQQLDKIRAYKYCSNERIMFTDSDCIFYEPFDIEKERMDGGKIILPKTRYSSLRLVSAYKWREATRKSTGIDPQFEYMRCFPILHHSDSLRWLDESEHFNKYLNEKVKSNRSREHILSCLSEFNAIGVIAEEFYSNHYRFIDTDCDEFLRHAKQYWSWGGLTPKILTELESI